MPLVSVSASGEGDFRMRVGGGEGEDRGSCGWLFVLLRPFRGPEVASLSVSRSLWGPPLLHSSLASSREGRPLGAPGLRCPSCHLAVGARRYLALSRFVPHSPHVLSGDPAAPGGRDAGGHRHGAGQVVIAPRGCVLGSPGADVRGSRCHQDAQTPFTT